MVSNNFHFFETRVLGEGVQAIQILSSDCSGSCFSVAGTHVFEKSMVVSVAGRNGASGDNSQYMIFFAAGRNVHFQDDEGHDISCNK